MPKDKGYSYGSSKMDRERESMGMKDYLKGYDHGKMSDVMGHDSEIYHVNALAAQKSDLGRLNQIPMQYRGTPEQAFDYKY